MPNRLKITTNHTPGKDIYFELDSGNNVSRMAITGRGGERYGNLRSFLDECIQNSAEWDSIPDNIILHYENISPDEVPAASAMEQQIRFIIEHGVNEYNSISLRKVAFLDFFREPVTAESLNAVESRDAYRRFIAYENAIEKLRQNKPVKMTVTVAETNRGIVVFSDSLRGQKAQRDYLQFMADKFFSPENEGLDFLQLFRFETTSIPLIDQADKCCCIDNDGKLRYDFTPSMNPQIALLNGRSPMIGFDMRPNCPNLDTFLSHTGVGLSDFNNDIFTLESFVRDGYIGSQGMHFSYEKEFRFMETALSELRRDSRNNPRYPFKEKYEQLQNNAKQLAHRILHRDMNLRTELTPEQILRELHTKPSVRESHTRKTVPEKPPVQPSKHLKQ